VSVSFRVELLGAEHDRTAFSCGVPALDSYFRTQVTQDMRRRASACFVAIDNPGNQVAGFYALAAGGVPLNDLDPVMAKRLPRYPSVPVARLGRLAVAVAFHGRKLGAALLADAALRAMRSEVAVFALVVDAKNAAAEAFYRHHGFERYGALPRQLILPLGSFPRA
jgi:ribosomal protein S18 acetylase RimI-like enzyme